MLTIFINRYCVVNRNRMPFPLIDDLIHVLAYLIRNDNVVALIKIPVTPS